ncbi:hypothetical protein SNE35_08075 [Paucibacter sp. R3-3]|uniref:Uncharacterized protein n=1 Tax=Roseateles agri TaxID=3098619 RepID=A0ABU5DDW1_9BURK|nr:hypothetical protein [Paucibacter sp. R3-3]MDY0744460.1 hypothetical protein [Paucibacter sp. R3-3]
MSRFIAPHPLTAQKTGKNTLCLAMPKPRNPLTAAGLMRQAGSHSRGNERQQARRQLDKQITAELGGRSP